jgi:hypothetical protein
LIGQHAGAGERESAEFPNEGGKKTSDPLRYCGPDLLKSITAPPTMKLKCPACSKTLQIPESAAGKVVKCGCGKQIRVPGDSSAPGNRASQAGSPQPQPTPSQSLQNAGPSLFDELTDQDMEPISQVKLPGHTAKPAAPKKDVLAEFEEPSKKNKKKQKPHSKQATSDGKSKGKLILIVAVVGVLVLAGGGIATYFIMQGDG